MNRILFAFLLTIIYSTNFFGQNDILTDSISEKGQLIQMLSKNSVSGFKMLDIKIGKEYIAYRLCNDQYVEILKLEAIINDSEIEQLQNSQNGTLKCVGFILFAKRNNTKESVMGEINNLLKQEYSLMTRSCSDAISIQSLPEYCYDLIIYKNFFFKPSFRLKKKEQKEYKLKMIVF